MLWLLWIQFPNQGKAVCDGSHECDRCRLYWGQKSECVRTSESTMKPRFLAKWTSVIPISEVSRSEWLVSVECCCGPPMRRNSVFVGLKTGRCADIWLDISWTCDDALGSEGWRRWSRLSTVFHGDLGCLRLNWWDKSGTTAWHARLWQRVWIEMI